ncbi:unnamed protein product [Arabis nemorensis]|uniref:Uncharacterized protein n=1 Tax=Arabis nemorensis TaxID=586526 RepID=A0A565CBR3_9BRAS|nr:unnamed protein product [Arabis nemorensis]
MTFHGYVDENVLSEELLNKCCEAGLMIEVAPKAEGVKRLDLLFVYILLIAYNKRGSKYSQNILVLSKDIGQGSQYVQFLETLESEYMNVGFADLHMFVNSGLSGSKQQIVCAECKEFLGYRLEDPDRFQSLELRNLNLSGSSQAPIISTQAPIVRSESSQAEKHITLCAHCQFCVNAS